MTQLYYNGVRLKHVLTKQFREEAVYDPSGAALEYHKFTIRVEGILHRIVDPITGIDILPGDWTDLTYLEEGQRLARQRLMQPKKLFWMSLLDGDPPPTFLIYALAPWYPSNPVQVPDKLAWRVGLAPIDVNNGPKPRSCNIEVINGLSAMRVSFEIEVCIKECPSDSAPSAGSDGIISNRWAVSDSLDENWLTTRTITGRLRVAQNAANVNMFRSWVIPPIQSWFKRVSIQATASPDGLSLDYTIIDREVYAAAPYPAMTWAATDTAVTQFGSTMERNVTVMVQGHRATRRLELLAALTRIIYQQIRYRQNRNKLILKQAHLTAYLHENKLEMSQTYIVSPKDAGGNTVAGIKYEEVVLPYDDIPNKYNPAGNSTPPDNIFGTATTLGLFVCHLRDGCVSEEMGMPVGAEEQKKPKYNTARAPQAPDEPSTQINYDVSAGMLQPEEENDPYAMQHINEEVGYTYYDVETVWSTSQHMIAMPVAASSDPQDARQLTTRFVRMAPPQTARKVIVTAVRFGDWPRVPEFRTVTDQQTGRVLQLVGDAIITPRYPPPSADKHTRKFEMVCEYAHVVDRTMAGQDLQVGRSPYDTQSLAETAIRPDIFDPNLLT